MSEGENNTQRQKIKTSRLAILSILLGALGLLASYFHREIIVPPAAARQLCIKTVCLMGVVGFFVSLAALLRIKKSKKILRGLWLSILGMVLCLSNIGVGYLVLRPRSTAYRMLCGSNLSCLGKALLIYERENGRYPEPEQWCDLLLNDSEIQSETFICPTSLRAIYTVYLPCFNNKIKLRSPFKKKGRCSYAMNPNCEPNLPPDTVLLFETEDGWNQYGGKEILTKENHYGEGCNVLFNGCYCNFVQNPEKLNWGNERKQ